MKKYYDYDDIEYKAIRDVKNLFDLSIDEDYYKPIGTKSALNGYIKYESKWDKDKFLSIKEDLHMIRPYLSDITNDHKTQREWKVHSGNTVIDYKTQSEWKIQLTIKINLVSSNDSDETRTVHTNSDNIEIMMGSETDEVIKEFFKPLLEKYQKGLEEKIRGSEFVFYSVGLLLYKLHKISLNRGRSYIDSLKWLKNKNATINPKNKDDKYFQYALTLALNYQNIKKDPQKYQKLSPLLISTIAKK